ncbi:MAG: DUF72 domain-containing protein [Bryobacteraceae bacterium]|nr:DUF72 domain-containing protein [Bryobacterales bacterium]MEB2364221.1 DUF72 domain-containing protein [Bryobacterales bacterium]NUN02428.1 DUF72 domain-containing protein [Bryobacteraceae bacterium]
MAQLYAGTSGFAYPQWKPAFYPLGVPAKDFLRAYSGRLNCVEINYTFRRLVSASVLANWISQTTPGFVFAVKAHMRLTHVLRLRNAGEFTSAFLNSLNPLQAARRLGPVLFQLPPQFQCDAGALEAYCDLLPLHLRFAFEFRHRSWLVEPVYDVLRRYNMSLCVAESDKLEVPEVITADFVYYRLRKPEYSLSDIEEIGERAGNLLKEGKDLYLIFKHEDTADGALNAERVLLRQGGNP